MKCRIAPPALGFSLMLGCCRLLTAGAEDPPPPAECSAGEEAYMDQLRHELSRLSLERDKLVAENSIARARLEQELAERRAEMERERLAIEEAKQRIEKDLSTERQELDEALSRLQMENERLQLESSVEKARAEIEATKYKAREAEARARISELQLQMDQREAALSAGNYAEAEPVYTQEPLQDGVLTISDRRISLNGPVTFETAEYVSSRINYFNNKDSRHPIFLVIDSSPGGSVMAGYNILKSMASSQAPVHVVVKSFAASMAACIATCADRSYCYPNAIILHHQISGGTFGNLTQHRENLEEIEEWWRRLSEPVARKMGIEPAEFVERMYREVSTGDWTEFGDKAAELKWIDFVVQEIRETALVKNPDHVKTRSESAPSTAPNPRPSFGQSPAAEEQVDEKGRIFARLPRLAPKDFYYLYNPDGYYRVE